MKGEILERPATSWSRLPKNILPPFISIILPAASNAFNLVNWTLRSYEVQTIDPKWFEVILVDDGGPSSLLELSQKKWSFNLRYFVSPRVKDPKLAHKNHARNIGWQWAKADVCFICDCDCLVHASFVERVIDLYLQADAKEEPFVLYPMIANLRHNMEHFATEENWREILKQIPQNIKCSGHSFGGNFHLNHIDHVALHPLREHPEGYHILSRRIFEILGGFDEAFLGWGGNKQEFQQRIIDARTIKQYLLRGCTVFHQPHSRQPGNQSRSGNHGLMNRKRDIRRKNSSWQNRISFLTKKSIFTPGGTLKQWLQSPQELTLTQDLKIQRTILRPISPQEKKVLFVGPWIGEFGWEICRWQGGVRKQVAEQYSDYYVIVCGDQGHHPLYEYAHEFWSLPQFVYKQKLTRETHRLLPKSKAAQLQKTLQFVIAQELLQLQSPVEFLMPKRFFAKDQTVTQLTPSKAAMAQRDYLIKRHGVSKWVCVFPRKRALNPQKNWPEENWQKLMDFLFKEYGYGIILMGREEDTSLLEQENLWFISTATTPAEQRLDLNIAFLEKAVASIGSESGGPFLSLLCGCPTFVMGGTDYKKRYQQEENYLNTPCYYVAKAKYHHPYETTLKEIKNFFATLKPKQEKEQEKIVLPKGKRSYQQQYQLMKELFNYDFDKRINNLLIIGQHKKEFEELDQLLQSYSAKHPFKCFVELGVYMGASAWLFSRNLEKNAQIIGIDNRTFANGEYCNQVFERLNAEGFKSRYLLQSTNEAVMDVKKLAISGVDLLFIDADHTYQSVKQDWNNYIPLVNKGGIILLHDIHYITDITKFWEEIREDLEYKEIWHGGQGMAVIFKH